MKGVTMISRDYTQEIGMPIGEKPVSRPVTIVFLTLVALVGAVCAWQILAHRPAAGATSAATQAASR